VLLEDNLKLFKPQCSLDARKYIVLHTGLLISGTACQVILLMLAAFQYLKHKLEFVDFTFTSFVRVEFA